MMVEHDASYGRPYPRSVARRQRWLTTVHTWVYQLSGGRLGATLLGMPMLLLTTWGRRTGQLRTAPLLYLPVPEGFVLVASNGGARQHPTWWFNLQTNPNALVQVGATRGHVTARSATSDERHRFWPLLLHIYPTYADYQARTDREIPLVVLEPQDTYLADQVPTRYKHLSEPER